MPRLLVDARYWAGENRGVNAPRGRPGLEGICRRGVRLRGGRQPATDRHGATARRQHHVEAQPRRLGYRVGAAASPPSRRLDRLAGGCRRRRRTEDEPIVEEDLRLHPVRLSADDVAEYYEGFSNATLWPLYHDVIVKPIYHREWWDRYVEVNRRFAKAASHAAAEGRPSGCRTTSCNWSPRCCANCGPI